MDGDRARERERERQREREICRPADQMVALGIEKLSPTMLF
jgi:hypothetical protein